MTGVCDIDVLGPLMSTSQYTLLRYHSLDPIIDAQAVEHLLKTTDQGSLSPLLILIHILHPAYPTIIQIFHLISTHYLHPHPTYNNTNPAAIPPAITPITRGPFPPAAPLLLAGAALELVAEPDLEAEPEAEVEVTIDELALTLADAGADVVAPSDREDCAADLDPDADTDADAPAEVTASEAADDRTVGVWTAVVGTPSVRVGSTRVPGPKKGAFEGSNFGPVSMWGHC